MPTRIAYANVKMPVILAAFESRLTAHDVQVGGVLDEAPIVANVRLVMHERGLYLQW